MGGLTAGSLLAQLEGKRVLILERHFTFGGFTHVFSRKGFTWDVGIHYVGNMGEGMPSRRMMDLVTGHGVEWQKMPERFDRFVYPDFTYDVPSDAAALPAGTDRSLPQRDRWYPALLSRRHEAGALAGYRDLELERSQLHSAPDAPGHHPAAIPWVAHDQSLS